MVGGTVFNRKLFRHLGKNPDRHHGNPAIPFQRPQPAPTGKPRFLLNGNSGCVTLHLGEGRLSGQGRGVEKKHKEDRDGGERVLPRVMADAHEVARLFGRIFRVAGRYGLLPVHGSAGRRFPTRVGTVVRRQVLDRLLDHLTCRLAVSRTVEHRDVAAALAAAVRAEDYRTALALVTTAGRRTDLRAEKMISRRYRFLWICNPKVASRSIIAALRAADPEAELLRGQTLDEVLKRRPETRGYFSFAFVRHPCDRIFSAYADKHSLALHDRDARRWFIEPYYGLTTGMSFGEFCRWLNTPWGSDAFADRHWLSQHRQVRTADGRFPDFLGHWESLDADWRMVTEWVGMPYRDLPRLNVRPKELPAGERPDAATAALLRRRYTEDFKVGGYGDR